MRPLYLDIEIARDFSVDDELYEKAKLKHELQYMFLPAYNQIIAISIWGYSKKTWEFLTKELDGSEEAMIQELFATIEKDDYQIIWYNIVGFDLPFIIHRALKYGIKIPQRLKVHGVKPWDVAWHLDLMSVLSYTGKRFYSLHDVCLTLGIPVKTWMEWDQVQEAFEQWRLREIQEYCTEDVAATQTLHQKLIALNLL